MSKSLLVTKTFIQDKEWVQNLFLAAFENKSGAVSDFRLAPAPIHDNADSYARIIRQYKIENYSQRLIFAFASISTISPSFFNDIQTGRDNPFVFRQYENSPWLVPTIESIIRLLCGKDDNKRFHVLSDIYSSAPFSSGKFYNLSEVHPGEPITATAFSLSSAIAEQLISGKKKIPEFSKNFPARLHLSKADWNHLFLKNQPINQLNHLKSWIREKGNLAASKEYRCRFRPGFKTLFYGPSGTGKSMAAALIGIDIVNPKLFNPELAQKLGYAFRQINNTAIELSKNLK